MIGKTNSINDLYSLNPNFIPAIFHGERRIVSYNWKKKFKRNYKFFQRLIEILTRQSYQKVDFR